MFSSSTLLACVAVQEGMAAVVELAGMACSGKTVRIDAHFRVAVAPEAFCLVAAEATVVQGATLAMAAPAEMAPLSVLSDQRLCFEPCARC